MRIKAKDLLHLPVETESGDSLGRVVDFEVDVETHGILQYHVARYPVVDELLNRTFLVGASQVVSISVTRMIVKDTILRDAAQALGLNLA